MPLYVLYIHLSMVCSKMPACSAFSVSIEGSYEDAMALAGSAVEVELLLECDCLLFKLLSQKCKASVLLLCQSPSCYLALQSTKFTTLLCAGKADVAAGSDCWLGLQLGICMALCSCHPNGLRCACCMGQINVAAKPVSREA